MSKNIICYGVILREHFGFAQCKLSDRRTLETLRFAQGDMRIAEHSYA